MNKGMILRSVAGKFDVWYDNKEISVPAAGRFRNEGITPLPGDCVLLADGESICDILPRKNALVRPPVANVSMLVIVLATKKPLPDLLLVDKLILHCRKNGIEPLICINKSDLDALTAESILADYKLSNINGFITCSTTLQGVASLKAALPTGISCFCGQSAVGKSSLMNIIAGKEISQTGGLSRKTDRGKNTTRQLNLVNIGDGRWLADTPGFSLLDFPPLSPRQLTELYTEFAEFSPCRFRECAHVGEPDCAVRRAVDSGMISKNRYERYLQIYKEISENWRRRYD